jgi:hypothetical protein
MFIQGERVCMTLMVIYGALRVQLELPNKFFSENTFAVICKPVQF